ncbi:zinc finger, C3HC4 type [Dictyocaulus viviparus]|uniref:E3 ubiquitin-protein ligase RNF170 n=1 Tax=Dictyocaulus viviparus TaxID=29172 RepID=A0A0D8XPW2_DICVI|nr:zinc finger, C3HC4 type [Dictyocaulus viviparus]
MLKDIGGQVIEGFSNEALILITVVVASFIVCTANYLLRESRAFNIHPDLAVDVQGFRESHVRGQSGRVNETNRILSENADSDRICPICYGSALYPILTNCGHLFCCECIMGYWRHAASLVSPVNCAVCRTQVTVLLPLHWPNEAEDNQLHENNIALDDYNRRFSGDRPWVEYLWDLPVLIPYILRNLFDFNGFMIMFRFRIFFVIVGIIAYVLSPFDIIPESAYGIIGLMDDIFVSLLLLVYIVIAIRHFMARRGEAPAQ